MNKFSLICATYNAAATIDNLLNSIISLDFKDYELIIVDGGSTDNTLNILKSYSFPELVVISEKDKGIYDAMNKGIATATGEWILFMGADDRLYSNDVLSSINKIADANKSADGLYGNVLFGRNSKKFYNPKFTSRLLFINTLHHQGIFYHKRLFTNYRFNINYTISGDYELNLMLYLKKANLIYTGSIISIAGDEGISSQLHKVGYIEEIKIRENLIKNKVLKTFLNLSTHIRFYIKKYFLSYNNGVKVFFYKK